MPERGFPPGVEDALRFPLLEALVGRRSRRFSMGASIRDGVLAYTSKQYPLPLTDLERLLVVAAAAGNTGWHFMHIRHSRYAPRLSNYSGSAGGRAFPSGAGFHTSEVFFTDDEGVYFLPTRDAPSLLPGDGGELGLGEWVAAHRARVRKLADTRLRIPAQPPSMEGHNTWCANAPGSLLLIPVADVAQHLIATLCYLVQNGGCIYDDVNDRQLPGLERFGHLVNLDEPLPLTEVEQEALAECSTETSCCCYSGMLMLQAMGLGGWMYDGIDRLTVLGASGSPDVPGLGFRYDEDEAWAVPNPTGLPGVFEAYCPPHYPDMRAAVDAFAERKFGPGGPFHPETPGPWADSGKVRGAAEAHSDEFKACVALMAQYVYDTFGKFPGMVPSVYILMYLQAHHLDLEFYDHHFAPGAYLATHARHMDRWHPKA